MIDYDTLMDFHDKIAGVQFPVSNVDQLLDALIEKRNDNPCVDQMILIFAFKAIGESRYPIPNVSNVLMSIMNQRGRINEWGIAFVAEAIEKYPFDIASGDELMDHLEETLRQVKSRDDQNKEYFGYHFPPPPKSRYILGYINSIPDMRARQKERNSYYVLISNGVTEVSIEEALGSIQLNGMIKGGNVSANPLEYLPRNQGDLPFRRAIIENDKPDREH